MAVGLQLNRGQIINQGLQLGGNPGLNTNPPGVTGDTLAQQFFNLLLDHTLRGEDWPFLRKVTTVNSSGGPGGFYNKIPGSALPSDYSRIHRLHAPKDQLYLQQVPHEDLWIKLQNDVASSAAPTSSTPRLFSVDEGSTITNLGPPDIYLYPNPNASYTYDLIYYAIPTPLTLDSQVPVFPDHLSLVYAIAEWAKDYTRDTTQAMAVSAALKIKAMFKANMNDQGRSHALQVKFDDAAFPAYRVD